jgi:hypothetical protein
MEQYPLIRKIYLYLFSLIGLILMVIAGVQLINLGLKVFVFTQIEKQDTAYQGMPSCGPFSAEKVSSITSQPNQADKITVQITASEQEQMKLWLTDYKTWEENQKSYDPIKASRQRDAASSLAMLIIGLPLYMYHWRLARKEIKA